MLHVAVSAKLPEHYLFIVHSPAGQINTFVKVPELELMKREREGVENTIILNISKLGINITYITFVAV